MLKKLLMVSTILLALAVPSVAVATQPTNRHVGVYFYLRRHVDKKFGHTAAGRNIINDGRSDSKRVSDADVVHSNYVMERMLLPPAADPVPPPSMVGTSAGAMTTAATGPNMQGVAATPAPSGLEQCIIQHESGGNSQAVNGQYEGIGQWSPSAWASDGGTKYASSPLGASAAQQEAVLRAEGASTMQQQQGQYDGCG